MKLLPSENDLLNKFDFFCKKTIKFSNYELIAIEKRIYKKMILYPEFNENIFPKLYTLDDYKIFKFIVNINNFEVAIENELLYKALMLLSDKKREIILLSFFMDMTDDEIGKQMLIPKSSIQYNRKSAINYIRDKMKRRK